MMYRNWKNTGTAAKYPDNVVVPKIPNTRRMTMTAAVRLCIARYTYPMIAPKNNTQKYGCIGANVSIIYPTIPPGSSKIPVKFNPPPPDPYSLTSQAT